MDKELHLSTIARLLKQGEYDLLADIHALKQSEYFDPDFYLNRYPGVRDAGIDPYYHYALYGWRDKLEPSEHFSCAQYIAANPDLDASVMSPLIHYIRYGKAEGRQIKPVPVCENVALEIARLRKEASNIVEAKPTFVVKVRDLLLKEFRDLQPIPYFLSMSSHTRRLVFVTDALGNSLLGGIGTALILASQYAVSNEMDLMIVTRQSEANPSSYFEFMRLMREQVPNNVFFYSDSDRTELGNMDYKLEVFEDDEFFTTSWWTTKAVKNMHLPNKLFYIIQEVEQFFYPYCDLRLKCSQLSEESGICYLVNSKYLWEYFEKEYPYICASGCYFDPAFPPFIYAHKQSTFEKRRVFFYSRSKHPRNLYYTGLEALDEALKRGIIDTNKWEIFFAGDSGLQTVEFSDGTRPQFLGQISWRKYAEFLSTIDLTFSLMYTPHPSYPPLDTLASGGVCVTNKFANKNKSIYGDNMILADLSIEGLCNGLKEGVALSLDNVKRMHNFRNATLPRDWKESLSGTIKFMKDFVYA